MTKQRRLTLTELEGSVLGMVGLKGPCTPYAIRREFQESPSQYWSASSGSAYPLMLRLARRGLVREAGRTEDGREGRLYVLTAAGQRALQDWLAALDASATISVPADPLRNRIAFFAVLDAEQQRRLLGRSVTELQAYLETVRAHTAKKKAEQNLNEYLVSAGAQRMLEARLDWLREVARAIGG